MSNPFPIRSPLNPALAASIRDYSYTSPLSASGANFPCKGYAQEPFNSIANYAAGEVYSLTLEGTATHGGGSYQIALSFDRGETFQVIKSILGHCPEAMLYTFQIPEDAPSGPALLAWTWFNKVGKREMYMNCAQVTVHAEPTASRNNDWMIPDQPLSVRWADRPAIFVANVNAEGQCTTIENEEVNFPRPGPDTEGSLSEPGFWCAGPPTFAGSGGDPPQAIALSNTPTASTALTSVTYSRTPIETGAISGVVADPAFGINIINNLDSSIHAWSVARKPGVERVINARGGAYFKAWRAREDEGGISIKMALEASQESVLQFKYSL
jgi:hypothetical protein